jgi:hypothetical protein
MREKPRPATFICENCKEQKRFDEHPPTPKGWLNLWCGECQAKRGNE